MTNRAAIIELWQTEWCPASHHVRQRLSELGISYLVRQVPVEREHRSDLIRATGQNAIPALVADGHVIAGEREILTYLDTHFAESPEAERQRAKAVKAKHKELEKACRELTPATH